MKAVALTGPEQVEIIEVTEPECGPRDVVLRMLGVGLCGTDVGIVRGHRSAPRLPWVLGHEGVGEVVAVGEAVRDRHVGQRAAIEPNYCCLRCSACRKGFTSRCADRVAVGLATPGVLAEYVAVPAEFTHPAPGHVQIPDLVCAEPLTVARAAVRRSGIGPGESCLVVGAGSQGLFVCASLIEAGIVPFVQEPHLGRRELALSLGALPAGEGACVEHVFETSGVPAALRPAVDRLVPGGRVTLVGMSGSPLGLSSQAVVYRQLSLIGSLIYDHPGDFADTIAVLDSGALAPHRVLRAEYSLDDAAAAFAAVSSTPGKSWIRFDGAS
jgi:alcohol dehydrogenase/L-iditol 2-dehydrogenase